MLEKQEARDVLYGVGKDLLLARVCIKHVIEAKAGIPTQPNMR
jgi:hypothetical protein